MMDISYIINELGEDRENYFNAVAPPIIQTSNFAFRTVADMRNRFYDEYGGYIYSKGLNPTVDILRKKLAALDGAEDCLVFNSGSSAIYASVMANVKAGDHIVSVRKPYTWAQKLFDNILPRFGVTTTYIDGTDIQNFENAIRSNTTIIYLESPNSWYFELQDLQAVSKLARSKNILTICDNSYCTPVYQKPLSMGIDISLQSATKYIGGHSDVVAGVVCGTGKMMRKIFENEMSTSGNGISPFNAWLLIRGLRTLPVRLEKVTRNTASVTRFLQDHPKVESVIFPLNEDFPQYELAKRQMQGGCGLLSFFLKVNKVEDVVTFCENLQHILMAVSWGGYESLIIPACATVQPGRYDITKKEHRMLRLYIGQEEPEYIVSDLEQALNTI
ncbi:MAG: aminotransferase class I/II-fold pyridoxal phosphate-dependent enzyme [Chitinophagaceae bacterium]|nr:aminotransferase class I/II-fold pyridoxal phosphate-dependent enzyme [Chitinophagaceae bacterium]